MKVQDFMVRDVKFCSPNSNLAQVAEIMWNGACGTLPVLTDSRKLWSMITDRDICIALGTRNLRASEVHVSEVAAPRYFACAPDDDIDVALKTMAAQEVRRLPVVDDEQKLVGILSIDDIILHAKTGSEINFDSRKTLDAGLITTLKAICMHHEHDQSARAIVGRSSPTPFVPVPEK